jgi:predicted ATPase
MQVQISSGCRTHLPASCIVISGCSGGGKSTLLAELRARGCPTFEEPGRRVVREQLAQGGDGLPWLNVRKFAELCIAHSLAQLAEASALEGHAFFDRSIVDAVSALEHLALPVPQEARRALASRPYSARVFMTPPWPELFSTDAERRHTLADAEAEFATGAGLSALWL